MGHSSSKLIEENGRVSRVVGIKPLELGGESNELRLGLEGSAGLSTSSGAVMEEDGRRVSAGFKAVLEGIKLSQTGRVLNEGGRVLRSDSSEATVSKGSNRVGKI